jgi:hypothetical protein
MGCNSSNSTEEAENNRLVTQDDNKKNQETIEPDKEEKNNKKNDEKKNEDKNESKKEVKKEVKKEEEKKNLLNINAKKKISDKEMRRINTEENKRDDISNVLTEGMLTSDGHKLAMHKENCNGVTLMKGIEECFSEDLNEDEILQLVEDALGDNINYDNSVQIPGTITSNQAKAVAGILYKKINKKDKDEDDKSGDIDLKKYPELKGVNIKIGVSDLTKDVIKNIMFNGQKVDDCQIDLTYANLTKDNDNLKALSIQINP